MCRRSPELLEHVLDAVREARDAHGADADDQPQHRVRDERGTARLSERRDREDRRRAAKCRANAGGDGGGKGHRDERARAILEQEQLHREQHGAHGTAERRRHAGRGAGGEQRLPLVGGDANHLSRERAKRTARRDDRSFRAERTAGSDRDRGGDRLEKEHSRGNATLAVEHALHHLGYPVTANRRRAVARHHPDDDRAPYRDCDDEQRIVRPETRRDELTGESAKKRRVGDEANQADQ